MQVRAVDIRSQPNGIESGEGTCARVLSCCYNGVRGINGPPLLPGQSLCTLSEHISCAGASLLTAALSSFLGIVIARVLNLRGLSYSLCLPVSHFRGFRVTSDILDPGGHRVSTGFRYILKFKEMADIMPRSDQVLPAIPFVMGFAVSWVCRGPTLQRHLILRHVVECFLVIAGHHGSH